jgi:chromosomal replication initiator protein
LNEYINYLQLDQVQKFREKYRSIDVLLIDDVQFFGAKKSIQEEFFNTFNALKDKRKQIVMTSDEPPKNLSSLIESRLISRFEGGMLQEIESPNVETRLAIIKKKAESLSIYIPPLVTDFIAENIKSHVRAMEGALATVEVFLSANPSVTLDKVTLQRILDDFIQKESSLKKLTIEEIQQACAKRFGTTIADILSHERTQSLVTPRQLAMYISRKYTSKGLNEIAAAFDKKHATVISGCKTIQHRLSNEPNLKADLEDILTSLGYKLSDSME